MVMLIPKQTNFEEYLHCIKIDCCASFFMILYSLIETFSHQLKLTAQTKTHNDQRNNIQFIDHEAHFDDGLHLKRYHKLNTILFVANISMFLSFVATNIT